MSSAYHFLYITPYYAPAYSFGGVVSMTEGLAQALDKRGHQVTVLTTDAFSLEKPFSGTMDEIRNGVRVLRVPNQFYGLRRYNLSTAFAMKSLAEKIMPSIDIVHLHEFRTVENLLVAPIAAKMNKPIILSPHGTLTYGTGRSILKTVWDKLLSPRIAKHIQHVIALAEPELEDSQALWPQFGNRETQFSIIPNGVNPDDFANLPDASIFREKHNLDDALIVLFMGRLHQRKGVEVLAKAFLQADMPNTKIVFAGPDEGMRERLDSLADRRFVFTGFIRGEERLAALSAANLFTLPATGEGLSMAVLEAMAAGLPVLLSPGCNLPEAETANAGLVIQPTIDSLAASLKTLLADKDALAKMGNNARNLIDEHFTWEQIAIQIEALYQTYLR
jgi:glycosyltransferase involved in cell wall biosynthesis